MKGAILSEQQSWRQIVHMRDECQHSLFDPPPGHLCGTKVLDKCDDGTGKVQVGIRTCISFYLC
jgi:hypothetical protein